MATVSAQIIKHHQKKDGTWNVKIRITQGTSSVYIDTEHFVDKKQLDKKLKIKDDYVSDLLYETLRDYRKKISGYPPGLSAQEIKERLTEKEDVDFIAFATSHIKKQVKNSAAPLVGVVNSLKDYFKSDTVPIREINSKFLNEYESYLMAPRKLIRQNKPGAKDHEFEKPGLSPAGLHAHMRNLRLLFNAARQKYNDEDLGIIRIPHYPFAKYKVPPPPQTEKRALTVEQIIKIRDFDAEPGSRAEMARDLFMLSFYLLGMNAADLYELTSKKAERVDYNRSKTKGKRKDKAFFSVKLIDIAKPLYYKYAGTLQKRYTATSGLNQAINKGIAVIEKELGFNFDFYSARHSVGTIARRSLRYQYGDVGEILNHKDRTNSVTDIYVADDWSLLDEVQIKLVALLYGPHKI